jgi:hypothetical protein
VENATNGCAEELVSYGICGQDNVEIPGTYRHSLIMIYLLEKGRYYRARRSDNQCFADISLVLAIILFLFLLTRAPDDGGEETRHGKFCDLTLLKRTRGFFCEFLKYSYITPVYRGYEQGAWKIHFEIKFYMTCHT